MAAGWLFWPALLIVLPKWFSKVRHHPGSRRAFLQLMSRAVLDGLLNRLDISHDAVRRMAGPDTGRTGRSSG